MTQADARSPLEQVLRRDRLVALVGLLIASALAWAYIITGAGMDMASMNMKVGSMPTMTMPTPWTAGYFLLMFFMWAVMMMAMMLPSAAPMILLFATIERRRCGEAPFLPTVLFTAAYVLVWIGFSLTATFLQWQLDRLAWLSPAMAMTNGLIAGSVLIAAGLYQFTPLKQACLRSCRSLLEFIIRYWRKGPFGIGLRHGVFCLGCCWMLMLLLFVGGVMNLIWVALIAGFILLEKTIPQGRAFSYVAGTAMIVWGGWTLYATTMG